MAHALVEHHGGDVPASMRDLVNLPGVGRKTANVVLGHTLGVPGFPVNRHVLRVSRQLGLIRTDDPVTAEMVLYQLLPCTHWNVASDTLNLHGRRICKPRSLCDRCGARPEAVEPRRRRASPAREL